jgi:hypothetical protein
MKYIREEYRGGQVASHGVFPREQRGRAVQSTQRTRDEWDWRQDERRMCHDERVTEGNTEPLESYVRAALALQGYRFDEAQIAEITVQFSRLEAIAQTVMQWPLPFASEAAPVFRP